MTICITGHTSGIGKTLHEALDNTIGVSRSTGFDITVDDITAYIDPDTIFINNAFTYDDVYAQEKILLQSLHAKKIICVGTNSQYSGIYKESKDKLKQTCKDLFLEGYNVTYLALGKVDTPFQQKTNPSAPMIEQKYLINCVKFIIDCPYRIEILSIRPD